MATGTDAAPDVVAPPALSWWRLVPGVLTAASGLALFGLHWRPGGYLVLLAAVATALVVDRRLARDLALIAFGLVTISLVQINTDISYEHMAVMGIALTVAVAVPY